MTNPLTIAAAHAAGPIPQGREAEWIAAVKDIAVNLAIADQDIDQKVALLEKIARGSNPQNGGTKGWGIVRGTLRGVEVEERSKRGLLTYDAFDRKSGQMQTERIRTNFVSDPDAAAMVAKARALIGHEVDLYKMQENKTDGSGETVRILAHLVDRGVNSEIGQQRPPQQPQQYQQPPQQQQPATPVQQHQPQAPQQQAPQQPQAPAHNGEERYYDVNEAKTIVFNAAGGNKDLASEGWSYIGNPAQPLRQQVLDRAVQFVQAKLEGRAA